MARATPMTPALAAVVLGAKGATLALRILDGGGGGLLSPWSPLALLHQDLWLILSFAALEAMLLGAAARWPRAAAALRAARTAAYAAACAWVAINVPVARLFSTPATFSFLYATGTALADSASAALTAADVGLPLALLAAAVALARVRPPAPRGVRARAAAAGLLALASAIGWAGAARVPARGLERNAVVTLLGTTAAHYAEARRGPGSGGRPAPAQLPECGATDGEAADLRDLRAAAAGRNVIWVILESTAARFLPPYGAARDATPNLSALARDSVVFDAAYAAYPESVKGLYSMLCARPPLPRREAEQHAQGLAVCDPLPAILRRAGYRTALFHSGRFAYLGMQDVVRDRGFERLEDGAVIGAAGGGAFASSFGVDEAATVRRLLQFVDGLHADDRFLAVYMPIAGHHPYHAPGDGPRPFAERVPADAYANDLYAGDAAFGRLRDGLRRRGLDERTLYVVVGDHGEAFFEHEGNFAHSLFLYEENVRVPFFVAAPGLWRGQRRAPQLASLIDVAPTVLDLLGLPGARAAARADADAAGRTLLAGERRLVTFFTDQGIWQSALRDGRWKLIEERDSRRAQLFDLDSDPRERVDLAPSQPARVARYRACLAAAN